MKKITLLAAFFAVFAMNAQVTHDFEGETVGDNVGEDIDVPEGFINYDVDGDGFGWGLSNAVNYTQPFGDIYLSNFIQSSSFITTGAGGNGGNGALSPDNLLVLPQISIPSGATGVDLSYFVGSGTDPNFFSETYSVQVTTTNDQAAILAATPELDTTLSFQGGEVVTINLDAYAGMDVYISFRHYNTTDQWLLGLDDINIAMATLGQEDLTFGEFQYFVDANENLRLTANTAMNNVQLFNVLGQQVVNQKLNSNNETVSIASLKSGVYIASVTINGQNKSFKIVKR